jgi:hypothetical protein
MTLCNNIYMLKSIFCKLLLIFFIAFYPFIGFAQDIEDNDTEKPIANFTYDLDFTRSIWHGVLYMNSLTMQPSISLEAFDSKFTIWSNVLLTNTPYYGSLETIEAGGKFNEFDFVFSHDIKFGQFTFEPAIGFYAFPLGTDPTSGDVALTVSYDLDNFSLFTTHTLDIMTIPGSYFGELGIAYKNEFSSDLSLDSFIKCGWASSAFNETYFEVPKNAFNVIEGSVSLSYYIKKNLYIKPHLDISFILDGELRNELDEPDLINFGASIGTEF